MDTLTSEERAEREWTLAWATIEFIGPSFRKDDGSLFDDPDGYDLLDDDYLDYEIA